MNQKANEAWKLRVVARYVDMDRKWYLCHAASYQNAFRKEVNGFGTRGEAVRFAEQAGCAVEYHEYDQLQAIHVDRKLLDVSSDNSDGGYRAIGDRDIGQRGEVAIPSSAATRKLSGSMSQADKDAWAETHGIEYKREFGDLGAYLWRGAKNDSCWIGYFDSRETALNNAIEAGGTFDGAVALKSSADDDQSPCAHKLPEILRRQASAGNGDLPAIGIEVRVKIEGRVIKGVVSGHSTKDGMPTFDLEYTFLSAGGDRVRGTKWAWPEQLLPAEAELEAA